MPHEPTVYVAYGSNLSRARMRQRCPLAFPLGRIRMPNRRLEFRRYADMAPAPGEACPAALYRLTPRCEAALDLYEGVAKGAYRKVWIRLRTDRLGEVTCLTYRKVRGPLEPPPDWYWHIVAQGYADWGLDPGPLEAAWRRAARAEAAERAAVHAP